MAQDFYRGGLDLTPKPGEVKQDPVTSLLQPTLGISVWDRPDNLEQFGGAYRVTNVPPELQIKQLGKNPHHYEIMPAYPMPLADYEDALAKIILVPA